jgi:UDP-N-acetylmuramate--alanine ligase
VGVLIVLHGLGIDPGRAARAVEKFTGVGRRFDLKGEVGGITVIDDYAHHPQEIRVTLAAARERFPSRRIVAAFQPHTYSRTKMLVQEFADALSPADLAIVLDIYAAREIDSLGISSQDIVDRMSGNALTGGSPVEATERLAAEVKVGDVVLTLGAGDVTSVGPMLLERLRNSSS